MDAQKIKSFSMIGISVKTTNEKGQSGIDIPSLWNKFMTENMIVQIPNKIDNTIYCIYTDYEKDHTKPYTTILGCKVAHLDAIPEGMTGITIKEGNYTKHTAKGNILQGIVFDEWTKIWSSDIPRTYTADFEVYDERAQNPENAIIDIFISVK